MKNLTKILLYAKFESNWTINQRCVSNQILQSSNPNSSTIWFDGEKIAIARGSISYLPLPFTDCIKYASNLLQMNNFYPQQLLSSEIDSFFLAFFSFLQIWQFIWNQLQLFYWVPNIKWFQFRFDAHNLK